MGIYEELQARGLIAQVTDEEEIRDLVNNGKAVFYIGFDPTADSLHVGHFMALCLMKRLQEAGNKPIALIGGGTKIISKIETIDAVENIAEILPLVRYILVDRGDLSTDIGIAKIPRFQRYIIEKALYADVKIFLATQVLKNMETKPLPTIGEIEALYDIMKSGVYGVQMSEETAVGRYVPECVALLNEMSEEVEKETIHL